MFRVLVLVLCFAGCGSYVHGLSSVSAQNGYRLNSAAICERPMEALQTADLAIVLYAQEVVRRGWVTYEKAIQAAQGLVACIIPKPEKCCAGSEVSCVRDSDGVVREKAGCSVGLWSWSSAEWPAGTLRNPAFDLAHEIGHGFAEQLGIATNAQHSTVWHTEIEPIVIGAMQRFLVAPPLPPPPPVPPAMATQPTNTD